MQSTNLDIITRTECVLDSPSTCKILKCTSFQEEKKINLINIALLCLATFLQGKLTLVQSKLVLNDTPLNARKIYISVKGSSSIEIPNSQKSMVIALVYEKKKTI